MTENAKTLPHSSHWGAFRARVENGKLVGVEPFEKDRNPSPLLRSIPDALYHKTRVPQPMVRAGWLERGPESRERRGEEPFVPVSWEVALDLVADELKRVKEKHGNASIFGGSYGWGSAGRFHQAKIQLHRFLNTIGGFTAQVHTYSIAAGYAILPYALGDHAACTGPLTSWDSIARHGRLVVMFGGLPLKNVQVCHGGPVEHATLHWLRRARGAGVEFVNIGPLREDAPDFLGAEWIAPRPNTDTALMLGLAHTLQAEGLHDRAFLARYCAGYERFERYLLGKDGSQPKDAAWAARICDIEAEAIRRLARRMAARRTLISVTWSLQRADHGEQPFWAAVALAAMLGQIGLPGGGLGFGYGSMGGMGNPRLEVGGPSLDPGPNPSGSFIPVARIADMLLNPGGRYTFDCQERAYPGIQLVYWCGGNPFHHHQDLNRLVQAWKRPGTVVVHEPWWTPAARHADIVLPATTTLERNDIGACGNDRFLIAMHQAVEPVGGARNDFDIFTGLAGRLGTREAFTGGRGEMAWVRHLYEAARQRAAAKGVALPGFEAFWREGWAEVPEPAEPNILYGEFRQDPEAHPLKTPSGKIELYSEAIARANLADCPPHPAWLEPAEWLGGEAARRYPLHLISNQPATRLHSQMDGAGVSRGAKVRGREPAWMNPADADARGLKEGDLIRVFNGRGATLAGLRLSDGVRRGVLLLPTGAWYDPAEPGRPGALEKHGNPNVLTLDKGSSGLGQGPIPHTPLVEAERYAGVPPAVTAF
ncbi:MAG: molybdopterin-dependent oxidoreductase, partial [Nitrospinota bacterium]